MGQPQSSKAPIKSIPLQQHLGILSSLHLSFAFDKFSLARKCGQLDLHAVLSGLAGIVQALLQVLGQSRRWRHIVQAHAASRCWTAFFGRPGKLRAAGCQGGHNLARRPPDALTDLPLALLGEVEQDGRCDCLLAGLIHEKVNHLLPKTATKTTTTMIAIMAPREMLRSLDEVPDAPPALSTDEPPLPSLPE